MLYLKRFSLLLLAMCWLGGCRDKDPAPVPQPPAPDGVKRLLVLTQTKGYRHSSIPTIVATLRQLGDSTGQWRVARVADSDAEVARLITADSLKRFDAVVFANTTGDLSFTPAGRLAFYEWVRQGGAYIGLHSATDTFHGDSLYLDLVRGEFDSHPAPLTVNVVPQDDEHPACQGMPAGAFPFFEEIYLFKNWQRSRVKVLLAQEEHPVTGALGDYPLAWTNRLGQGRMFYTALGHFEATYRNALFRQHLVGGIRWALGLATGDDTPGNQPPPRTKKLLVLTQTKGFRHSSIATIVATLRQLGDSTGQWRVARVADSDAEVARLITADSLPRFDAVVFANTTGNLTFTPAGRLAFYDWINRGGAFIGVHSATDTFHGDPLYLDLVRGEFDFHPAPLTVNIIPQDTLHPACAGMASQGFPYFEEIYVFKNWERSKVHVLLAQRQNPATGAPGDYPLAWTHRPGQGRMFYTGLGHFEATYADPLFRRHLVGGVRWALGLASGDETPGNPPR